MAGHRRARKRRRSSNGYGPAAAGGIGTGASGAAAFCPPPVKQKARMRAAISRLKRKPGFGNKRGTAPVRDQASRVGNGIDAAAQSRVWIPGKDKTVFFRQIGVVVAQIEVED